MPHARPEHTGARIAHYRKLRHLTQRGLADLAHVSHSTLKKVEQGDRTPTPAVLAALAQALRVTVSELTGQPYLAELRHDQLDVLMQPIREALDIYDLGADPDITPRPIPTLATQADQLCAAVRETRLKDVAAQLPALLLEATTAAHSQPTTEAWTTLASLYRTSYDVATKLGYYDLCTIALDRMAWAADRASDPVIAGVRQYLRSLAYLRAGQYRIGQRLVDAGLNILEQADAGLVHDAVVGQLHLGGAVIAARAQRGDDAEELLAVAQRYAETTGPAERVHWLSFGPANVGAHRVAVLSELGRFGNAVEAAGRFQIPGRWPTSRRAHHLTELAHAQLQTGQLDAAQKSLLAARAIAPQQSRYHPLVRSTVDGLLAARRGAPDSLAHLAAWVGL